LIRDSEIEKFVMAVDNLNRAANSPSLKRTLVKGSKVIVHHPVFKGEHATVQELREHSAYVTLDFKPDFAKIRVSLDFLEKK
jgi:transcription antitermination factor NusG